MTAAAWGRRDAAISGGSFALLAAWDASALDLPSARLFGTAQGFAARDAWWTSWLIHDGGRAVAWALLAGLLLACLRAPQPGGPARAQRWQWWGVTVLCLLAVPTLKLFSKTSCPWDLAEFGGAAQYVSHWRLGVGDGGVGRCFPSGHAVAAFAFLSQYFLWRDHARGRARAWLGLVMALGAVFGLAQLARGAHYPSHTLWSAWLCWTLCAAMSLALAQRARRLKPF